MELKLDRDLADRRVFPAIDPIASGTRNEDLLIDPSLQPFIWGIRRLLANMNSTERAATALVRGLKATKDNEEFLIRSAKKAQQTEFVGVSPALPGLFSPWARRAVPRMSHNTRASLPTMAGTPFPLDLSCCLHATPSACCAWAPTGQGPSPPAPSSRRRAGSS